jgi:hypothetical protein
VLAQGLRLHLQVLELGLRLLLQVLELVFPEP